MKGKSIDQEIVVLRAEKGWTQQQLATELGTSQRTVAAWEAGTSVPRKTMMVKIAKAFGLAADYFFIDNESDGLNGKERTNGETDTDRARENKMLEDIDNLVSNAYQDINDKKKSEIIGAIQKILDSIEK